MNYQIGDLVMFTDEMGKERIGKVINLAAYDNLDRLGIERVGVEAHGSYSRTREQVRPSLPIEIVSGDTRLGKTATILANGDVGVIDAIQISADGQERYHIQIDERNGHGGLRASDIVMDGE